MARRRARSDDRGDLTALLSNCEDAVEPLSHVSLVTALPGSIRAWVCHKRQRDRLA